ncbi:MAG: NAD/NADP-dependent betaine aldehyde dehydrogenase [Acidimicrobiales bacterium AG-410-I20]|nr:MAG: NAD/NADP-dependent betaine aldehyde dehydrogenase [Acidimicrobiales bacterium AG-410-I20]
MNEYLMYINGEFCEASDGGRFESINPSTGEPWATAPAATEEDVDRAVRSAHHALYEGPWSKLTATERGKMLFKLADLMTENSELLGSVETTDSGKLAVETRGQSAYVAEYYRYYGGLADKVEGRTLPIDKPNLHVFTTQEPIGVVAGIVPWNAEMLLTATKAAPALAAGNTVVIKSSEEAPAPVLEFARLVDEAGFPPGVFNLITGFGEPCGRALTSHPLVAKISFTGGVDAARHVVENTSQNFAPVSLELGGKSPIVIFDDADLEGAVNGAVAGNFGATGQSCVAGSRVFVQSGIYDEFIAEVIKRAEAVRIGDPLDADTQVGPLATEAQRNRIEETLVMAQEQGAVIHTGGSRPEGFENGWYFQPTVVACPDQSVETTQIELFGPVMSVLKFETEEDAVSLANDTQFGLGAGVFTSNVARAHRVSAAIRSGIVWVNTYRAISPIAPFGGFRQSGYGREAGINAIYDYTRTKSVWINTGEEPMANPFVMR